MSDTGGSDSPSETDGDGETPLSERGVGDGREKHVRVVTATGKEIEHGDVFLRFTESEYLISSDLDFPPAETTRYRKDDLDSAAITQHHAMCFITTATAGEGETLDDLRGFREDVMRPSRTGRGLLRIYDAVSPSIASTLSRHPDAVPTRLVRWLVERCAGLERERRAATGRTRRTTLAVVLVACYVVGVCLAVLSHGWLRARELT